MNDKNKPTAHNLTLNDISAGCMFSSKETKCKNSFSPTIYSSLRAILGAMTSFKIDRINYIKE